jgi:hypothetical protein
MDALLSIPVCIEQNTRVKNTFLHVDIESVIDRSSRNRRQSLPLDWKPFLPDWKPSRPRGASACSDMSTEYSPRDSIVSSSEDECVEASAISCPLSCCPCTPPSVDDRSDAVTSAIHSLLVACLPGDSVKIEKSIAERRVFISAGVQDGTLTVSRCYQLMQGVKQHLCGSVAHHEGLSLLSARVQKEDYGYSLRSSVACVPEDKAEQMCWDVLQKGSCRKRKCCRWYHPQVCDIVKFKVAIRC